MLRGSMTILVVEDAKKVYRSDGAPVEALRGVDLQLFGGEFLVLLGPSGCGKSTALRLLAGLEDITKGEIRIGGSRVNDLPPGARGLGIHGSIRNTTYFRTSCFPTAWCRT